MLVCCGKIDILCKMQKTVGLVCRIAFDVFFSLVMTMVLLLDTPAFCSSKKNFTCCDW